MNQTKSNELRLFNEIKRGNKLALDTLFETYYQKLCYFADSFVKDSYTAEELVADVFANLWINRKKIEIKQNVKSYLYQSTKNAALMYLRKNRLETEKLDAAKQIGRCDTNPERKLLAKETILEIEEILAKIPDKSRQVFLLSRMDGLKYREIAELLSISIKTVENHIGKALKIIRNNTEKIKQTLLFLLILRQKTDKESL